MDEQRTPDYLLFTMVMILSGVGIVMIFSTSGIVALEKFGDKYFFLKRQFVWLIISTMAIMLTMKIDYHVYPKLTFPLLCTCLLLLILVLIPGIGVKINGARRWLKISNFTFQVSEMAKLILVIYLAGAMTRKEGKLKEFRQGFLPLIIITSICCVLILAEPDLGTAAIILLVTSLLLFIGGVSLLHLFGLAGLAVPLIALLISKKPYMLQRCLSFLDPWQDPLGKGYHIVQGLIALGSGGVHGRGLGEGIQKMFYLPEAHTDFIFAIIGEEMGFIGTSLVLTLFFIVIMRGIKIALRCEDMYGCLLAAGIVTIISLQAMINIGVVVNLLPITGTTLPFISYGGSSLLINLTAVGILLNISAHNSEA